MAQMNLTPDQIPQALAQFRGELDALTAIMAIKSQTMSLLDSMEATLATGEYAKALSCFVEMQKLEYGLQIKGFQEKRDQLEGLIKQLESPLSLASLVPPGMPPFGGGGRRQ